MIILSFYKGIYFKYILKFYWKCITVPEGCITGNNGLVVARNRFGDIALQLVLKGPVGVLQLCLIDGCGFHFLGEQHPHIAQMVLEQVIIRNTCLHCPGRFKSYFTFFMAPSFS
jgi:hypothetical protein